MSNSRCQTVRRLGVGAMASVDLAEVEEGGAIRRVAVKRPHAFLAADPETVAAFEDEALLGASIRHPNVVRVLELVRGDELALVLEWVDGLDLAAVVRAAEAAGRRLPVDVVAAIARDVLAGLHAAHDSCGPDGSALGIVHRDVSPQNVLVGFDGVARVTDFGVAKAAGRHQHTEQGSVKGKLGYLAPEQLAGGCDRRADVHAVGVVLWELLTGTRLRSGDAIEILLAILSGVPRAPSSLAPEASCLDLIVARALARSRGPLRHRRGDGRGDRAGGARRLPAPGGRGPARARAAVRARQPEVVEHREPSAPRRAPCAVIGGDPHRSAARERGAGLLRQSLAVSLSHDER